MRWTPRASQLHGFSFERASCYGMPHFGAHYQTSTDVNSHVMDVGACCIVCGRPATNVHHHPPKGTCNHFNLNGMKLLPALLAMCGSGTTGCHGAMHAGRIRIRWEWDSERSCREWWEGVTLEYMWPHSQKLYKFGRWVIEIAGFRKEVRP